MTLPTWIAWLILAAVALERLCELPLAQRNTRALLAAGGYEVGAGHYPLLIAVHVLWLAALAIWIAAYQPNVNVAWLALYVAFQPLRLWVMVALGRYWTTRIIVVPDAPLIRRGPYRFMRHPNYAIVIAEIAILPLAFGAWQISLVFSALNAAALTVRLRAEDATLRARA